MKKTLSIILSGLLLWGCATQKSATSSSLAIELVQAGTDTTWSDGRYILHVAKRTDSMMEGIRLDCKRRGAPDFVFTADTGTISLGSAKNHEDKNSVVITLRNAQRSLNGNVEANGIDVTLELHT